MSRVWFVAWMVVGVGGALSTISLPFLFPSYKALDAVEDGEPGQRLWKLIEAKGVIPLAWGENGFRDLTNSKRAAPGRRKKWTPARGAPSGTRGRGSRSLAMGSVASAVSPAMARNVHLHPSRSCRTSSAPPPAIMPTR